MEAFLIVVGLGIAIFVYSNMKKSHSQDIFDAYSPIINNWVIEKGGVFESILSASYSDYALSVNKGATIFVGQFDRIHGESSGFYIEIHNGIVVLGKQYFPVGITSWHKSLSRDAKLHGITLYEILNKAEARHHEEFPKWKDVK